MNKLFLLKYRIKNSFLPKKITSKEYIRFLSLQGINVGEGTHFFDPSRTIVDVQRPWMLYIGDYCKITSNVTFLCHDYSRSVLRRKYGEVIGEAGVTIIGDNVFVGMGSTICMGANIGNNVIIGAGSVVTGLIPDDVVAAGVPAKIICSLDDYYKKRLSKTVDEAKIYAQSFHSLYGRYPKEAEMGPFWQLFMPRDIKYIKEKGIYTKLSGDKESEIIECFMKSNPIFESYDEFINSINA